MPDSLFDPLTWLATKGVSVSASSDGTLKYDFSPYEKQDLRARILRVAARYAAVLRLQLAVPAKERPRSVRQLIAAGRLRVREGRYEVEGRPPANPYSTMARRGV